MLDNIVAFFTSAESLLFLVFAMVVISGAILMLSFTKVVHMVVALAFTFLGLAGLYVMLDAEFVAFVQVLIYAGAVSILMIFGIMMTRHDQPEEEPRRPWYNGLLLVGSVALFGILFFVIQSANFQSGTLDAGVDNTKAIGEQLFTRHVIPFELMSVLLTVAFIGAIILAKREED
ncbi:NADH-quinone oxidoreductase subunit J [Xylanibacillus composti]|uniref:NADH-quinone oxidoreductase subunit J n=1 Tax=Xylanibacillus composti TaxID=1572762 RepID=A0A8J4M492_9BACL|nr:NADH-quinone oxidoreductase subunit J [Xylanibacillus composti]MDT9725981.1 NADH-quinone oxidoreductase subunit J [Xylanibacillus composti]GIQ70865.1 NADH:ubiquinone oxidoreductase subunit J [Xylanibacillus composti]